MASTTSRAALVISTGSPTRSGWASARTSQEPGERCAAAICSRERDSTTAPGPGSAPAASTMRRKNGKRSAGTRSRCGGASQPARGEAAAGAASAQGSAERDHAGASHPVPPNPACGDLAEARHGRLPAAVGRLGKRRAGAVSEAVPPVAVEEGEPVAAGQARDALARPGGERGAAQDLGDCGGVVAGGLRARRARRGGRRWRASAATPARRARRAPAPAVLPARPSPRSAASSRPAPARAARRAGR